jgi:hypothetical protein
MCVVCSGVGCGFCCECCGVMVLVCVSGLLWCACVVLFLYVLIRVSVFVVFGLLVCVCCCSVGLVC